MKSINLNDIRLATFIGLLALAPFSKIPSISLPLFNFPSFRIGAYQLLAALFVIITIVPTAKYFGTHLKQHKLALIGFGGIITSVLIGLLFVLNTPRSLLLATSLILLVLVAICGAWFAATRLSVKSIDKIIKLVLVFGVLYGVAALIQLVLATANTSALLCTGCASDVFGFARVNLFAAEPQFFANALMPFFAIAFVAVIKKVRSLSLIALSMVSLAISITFSRGAFIAIGIGSILLIALSFRNKLALKAILVPTLITICSFIAGFMLLVTAAAFKYNDAPYVVYNTSRGMIEQLTFGVVSLPIKEETPTNSSPTVITTSQEDEFISEGVVEASQNDRLEAARLALEAWSSSFKNIVFGTGIGNLGPYVVANINPSAPSNLTVYIFYVLLLAELGIVGLASFVFLFAVCIYTLLRHKNMAFDTVAIIIIMFGVQLTFFGSYINVVYIWLWLGIGLGMPLVAKKTLLAYNWQNRQ